MKILVLDDDPLVRDTVTELLCDAGFEVRDAADPKEALELLATAEAPPGLLITDIDLGSNINGYDVAAIAHRRWPTVRIILISGQPHKRTKQPLDPRDEFLQKPFSQGELLQAINALVNGT